VSDATFNPAEINLNLTEDDFADNGFKLIPVGTWVTTVIYDVQMKTVGKPGDNFGKPMYNVTFRVCNNEYGRNKQLRSMVCLWQGAHFTYANLVKALGAAKTGGQGVLSPEELMGLEVDVRIKRHREHEGNLYEEIGGFAPAGTKAGGVVSDSAAQEFGAKSGTTVNLFD